MKFTSPLKFMKEDITPPPPTSVSTTSSPSSSSTSSSGSSKYGSGSMSSAYKPQSKPWGFNTSRAAQFVRGFTGGGWGKCKGGITSNSTSNTTFSHETQAMRRDRYEKIIMEYMDMSDPDTVREAMSLNETEQNTLLVSLTNKLYQMIVAKVSSIDYGDIPNTKGNIRTLPKYKQMRECIEVLHNIFVQYKENTEPVDAIDNALSNLENYSDLFTASYGGDIKLGIMTYETAALGVVSSLGFMISVCIEYIKDPKKQGLSIVLNKTGVAKVKEHLVYENLLKFNEACSNGDLEKALRPLIKNKISNFTPMSFIHGALAVGVIAVAILPFLKQMTYYFYSTRVRVSTYFDAQADLLEMNANELKTNTVINTETDKNTVISRQLKIADLFHKIADKIGIDSKEAEIKATKDIKADHQRFKMDEVEHNPANVGGTNEPLF